MKRRTRAARMKPVMRRTTVAWLFDGGGCVFCHQRYGFGLERWCIACDRAVCPTCVVTTVEVLCPECHSGEAA